MESPEPPAAVPSVPLFTGDDYQLVVDAIYREEDRRELFERYNGFPAPEDDQLERLGDLARRLRTYLSANEARTTDSESAT